MHRNLKSFLLMTLALLAAFPAFAGDATRSCAPASEDLHYSWRLKGGLSWLASGLRFPTSGIGALRTRPEGDHIRSELIITPKKQDEGFYLYQSDIDHDGSRTLMTYHGYAYGEKRRNERTLFDYVKKLARIRKETSDDGVENKVKPLPPTTLRDVLTGIHFLRQNSQSLTGPVRSEIYSDGKLYSVVYTPGERRTFVVGGKKVTARVYRITAAPEAAKKFPGGVGVWISEDANRLPVRIEIAKNLAHLQLDLQSVDNCGV